MLLFFGVDCCDSVMVLISLTANSSPYEINDVTDWHAKFQSCHTGRKCRRSNLSLKPFIPLIFFFLGQNCVGHWLVFHFIVRFCFILQGKCLYQVYFLARHNKKDWLRNLSIVTSSAGVIHYTKHLKDDEGLCLSSSLKTTNTPIIHVRTSREIHVQYK